MNKSFKDRLAALEALEEQAELARAPITEEDRDLLYLAIEKRSVTMDASGRLVRSWATGDTQALDQALARCNTALAAMLPPLTTIEDIDAWIRELPDPDAFDDEELFVEVFHGLLKREGTDTPLSFAAGGLHAPYTACGSIRRYWTRVAERGALLLKAQGIEIFPLLPGDIRKATEYIDAGVITCQPCPEHVTKSHQSTVMSTHADPDLHTQLVWALDQYMYQVDCAPVQTTEELRADLVAALGQFAHDELQETA
jgi:hypothetical protein